MLAQAPAPWLRPEGETTCPIHGTENEGRELPTCIQCAVDHLDTLGRGCKREAGATLSDGPILRDRRLLAAHRAQCTDPSCACRQPDRPPDPIPDVGDSPMPPPARDQRGRPEFRALKVNIPPDLLEHLKAEQSEINARPDTLRPVRIADLVLAAVRDRYRDSDA